MSKNAGPNLAESSKLRELADIQNGPKTGPFCMRPVKPLLSQVESLEDCHDHLPGECPEASGIQLIDQHRQKHHWNRQHEEAFK